MTADPVFLKKVDALIRRCIHPADDIDGRNLLDPESRWSYTVFLHALGTYLDYKVERSEIDAAYAYARQALLAYAEWMAVHEEPYLDHPERLEYPTETWAAQEMWKSEVFVFAAKHAVGDERTRFLERSDFFFRYSTAALANMKTRTLTRPVVLLLSHGSMAGYARKHANMLLAPAPPVRPRLRHARDVCSSKSARQKALRCGCLGGGLAGAVVGMLPVRVTKLTSNRRDLGNGDASLPDRAKHG